MTAMINMLDHHKKRIQVVGDKWILSCLIVLLLSSMVLGTLAWRDLWQHKTNRFVRGDAQVSMLLLREIQISNDGRTRTELGPIAGGEFKLYQKSINSSGSDTQIGSRYITNINGEITIPRLAPGDYYFEQVWWRFPFFADVDQNGNQITTYPFTIDINENRGYAIRVKAYNQRGHHQLLLSKMAFRPDGEALSRKQQNQEFEFEVEFYEQSTRLKDRTIFYNVHDVGADIDSDTPDWLWPERREMVLGESNVITLKHGQTAEFFQNKEGEEGLPTGVVYVFREINVPPEFRLRSSDHQGTIGTGADHAKFSNTYKYGFGALEISTRMKGIKNKDLPADLAVPVKIAFSDGEAYPYSLKSDPDKKEHDLLEAIHDPSNPDPPHTYLFPLPPNDVVLFNDLPEGVTFQVWQDFTTDYADKEIFPDFTLFDSFYELRDDYAPDPHEYQGQIVAKQRLELPFTNWNKGLVQEDTVSFRLRANVRPLTPEGKIHETAPDVSFSVKVEFSEQPMNRSPVPVQEEEEEEKQKKSGDELESESSGQTSEPPSSTTSEAPNSVSEAEEDILIPLGVGTASTSDALVKGVATGTSESPSKPAKKGKDGATIYYQRWKWVGPNADDFEKIGEPEPFKSGDTLLIHHDEIIEFLDIPSNSYYYIEAYVLDADETHPEYIPLITKIWGSVISVKGDIQLLDLPYVPRLPFELGDEVDLTITMNLKDAPGNFQFSNNFMLWLDGKPVGEPFPLFTPGGEKKTIRVPIGSIYEFRAEYAYLPTVVLEAFYNGMGTADRNVPDIEVHYRYVGAPIAVTQVEKIWKDVPSSVTLPDRVRVSFRNEQTGSLEPGGEIFAKDDWKATFDVPRFNNDNPKEGEASYTVVEDHVPNFRSKSAGNVLDGFRLTNTYIASQFYAPVVEKIITGSTPTVPATFSFELWDKDATKVLDVVSVLGAGKGTFKPLDLEQPGTHEYQIKEVTDQPQPGYTYDTSVYRLTIVVEEKLEAVAGKETLVLKISSVTYSLLKDPAVVKENARFENIYQNPDIIDLTVRKVWVGGNPIQPASAQVRLVRNGIPEGDPVTLSAANQWMHTWKNLPTTSEWSVREVSVPDGYTPVTVKESPSSVVIYNEWRVGETVVVSGAKTWKHGDNPVASRPTSITIRIYNGNTLARESIVTAESGWRWSFTLPKYDHQGQLISYSLQELPIPDYTTSVSGFDVTNTHKSYVGKEFAGKKTWNHGANTEKPDSITIKVSHGDKVVAVKKITAKEQWKWSFDLPVYDDQGKEIDYQLTEEPIKGYKTTINGFDIHNVYVGDASSGGGSSSGGSSSRGSSGGSDGGTGVDVSRPPNTGDALNLLPVVLAALLSITGVCVLIILRKRKRDVTDTDDSDDSNDTES